MNESLAAACGEFEQVVLAGMLRSAAFGGNAKIDTSDDDDADRTEPSATTDAFSQLMTQALAGAVERAGGIGLRANLLKALERERP
jgi:hypothetical protein